MLLPNRKHLSSRSLKQRWARICSEHLEGVPATGSQGGWRPFRWCAGGGRRVPCELIAEVHQTAACCSRPDVFNVEDAAVVVDADQCQPNIAMKPRPDCSNPGKLRGLG